MVGVCVRARAVRGAGNALRRKGARWRAKHSLSTGVQQYLNSFSTAKIALQIEEKRDGNSKTVPTKRNWHGRKSESEKVASVDGEESESGIM